jgi:hypothetical protein
MISFTPGHDFAACPAMCLFVVGGLGLGAWDRRVPRTLYTKHGHKPPEPWT